MLTYTASSAPHFDYFSDQPWFLSEGYLDGLSPHARDFYLTFIDTYRQNWPPT